MNNASSNLASSQQGQLVSREQRERLNSQRGHVLWLTGLSGAGKSTLAYALEAQLYDLGGAAWCSMEITCEGAYALT